VSKSFCSASPIGDGHIVSRPTPSRTRQLFATLLGFVAAGFVADGFRLVATNGIFFPAFNWFQAVA